MGTGKNRVLVLEKTAELSYLFFFALFAADESGAGKIAAIQFKIVVDYFFPNSYNLYSEVNYEPF